jgi:pyridoxine 4-dehydrogenase
VVGLHRSGPNRDLIHAALDRGVNRIDTAYNYARGASQQLLRARAGDLLGRLRISTKVGFFPSPGQVEHSLDPGRLADAVRESSTTLGVTPEVVFLHNPERGLTGLSHERAAGRLRTVCEALRTATDAGWCQAWGISTWTPSALLPALDAVTDLVPGAVMLRAGLTVAAVELAAGEQLAARLSLDRAQLWGMAPFGGVASDPVWTAAVTSPFLAGTPECTPIQAAFRVAFEIPAVGQVAVGVSRAEHLHQLLAACGLRPEPAQLAAYRRLIDAYRLSASAARQASRRAGSNSGPAASG